MKRTAYHDNMPSDDNFMKKFKYYKRNKPKPKFDTVISTDTINLSHEIKITDHKIQSDGRTLAMGLQEVSNWEIVSFRNHPGFVLIRNPFTSLGQRYWIRKCLEEYPRVPNKRNIDIENPVKDWWAECYVKKNYDKKLLKKLRWTTLGYHHNWDTKVYTEENRSPFPLELAELCDLVACTLGYNNFRAEAAIVNYYHLGSTLSAHTDHSEVNLDAPLFSFSFGQSAVFLLGGLDKSVEPSAFLLTSGDIAVMSKEARLCYHAVPKIISAKDHPWTDDVLPVEKVKEKFKYIQEDEQIIAMNRNVDVQEWSKFNDYVQESRININVRQVLNENQSCLN